MRRESRSAGTLTTLIAFTLLYALLIILILVFARQILSDISAGEPLGNVVIIPFGIVLPAFLIGSIAVQLLRLFQDRRANRPGARFKIKLILFFTFISILSSLPQAVLSISFIDTAVNSWFSSEVREALDGGVEIALAYNSGRVENLLNLSESSLVTELVREEDPRRLWSIIREANSAVAAIQLFNDEDKQLSFFGDPLLQLAAPPVTIAENGIVPKNFLGDVTVQRVIKEIRLENGDSVQLVLSSRYPDRFGTHAENLTKSRQTFRQIEEYRTLFRLVLILFYSFFSVPVLLLSILVSFLLSGELIRPIAALEEATRRAMEGDFAYRILGRSGDELSILVASFNRMMSELENSRRTTLQTEKVTAWQEIAQRLAHEIRNPLTPIKLSAQRILRRYERNPEEIGEVLGPSVSSIVREVENLDLLLQEFRDFARLPSPMLRPQRLRALMSEIIANYVAGYPDIEFDLSQVDPELELPLDRDQMSRVFTNLFKNAVEAMGQQGRIVVRTDLVRKGNTGYCRIQVEDSGGGIPESAQGEVFNPYFTTKSHGTGLGLPIVERIIFDHHGKIWFESQLNVGTTFFIDLPMER